MEELPAQRVVGDIMSQVLPLTTGWWWTHSTIASAIQKMGIYDLKIMVHEI